MKVVSTASALNDNFYPEATGKLTNENTDPYALPGVALGVDDLGYIKQGNHANSGGSDFEPTQAQLDAMNSGVTSADVEQITVNKNNIALNARKTKQITYTAVAANTYEIVSDLAITVPAGKVLEFAAYGLGASKRCVAIKAIMFNYLTNDYIIAENDTGGTGRICVCITGAFCNSAPVDVTVNFYVKYADIGSNPVGIVYNIYNANQ